MKSPITLKQTGLCLFLLIITYICFSPAVLNENNLDSGSYPIQQEDILSHYIKSPQPLISSITYDYFRLVQQTAVSSIRAKFERNEKPAPTIIPYIFIIHLLFSLCVTGRPYDWLYPFLPSIPFLEGLKILHKKDGRHRSTCIYQLL